jgi:hypothetical protein
MNENEKDEELTSDEEELSESIDSLVEDLNERAENDKAATTEEDSEENEEFGEDPDEEEYSEDEDTDTSEDADEDANGDSEEAPAPEPQPEPQKRSEAERKYNAMIKQARKALENMGVEVDRDEDVLAELERINAEAEGTPIEEYRKKVADEETAEEANAKAWESRYASDLAEIQKAYPSAIKYKHLSEIPNVKRFAELMDTGKVSAVEAFKVTHPTEADEAIVKSVRQSSLNDTKSHLKSNVPKKSGTEAPISKSDMRAYREMFPDLSTKEIEALCRRVSH